MKSLTGIGVVSLLALHVSAQPIDVTFSINTSQDTTRISPYIYGANALSVDRAVRSTARRLGGNRMTGYNWENNASNAGSDYYHSSDDYMTWIFGIPSSQANIPGITLTTFHDTSLAQGCYTLLTLPAAGYVSRDKNGTVTTAQTAPSFRWRQVRDVKGAPFVLNPDTSDGFVYVDEEVNFLMHRYGSASTPTGVKGYDIDNEPALWPSTHPRIHPDTTLCSELIAKVAAGAKAVKSVDPSAEVFGGVFYGFGEYYQFQWSPDWNRYHTYENYAAALLSNVRDSSVAAGHRLLDVLDMHWYPDLNVPIGNENTDSLTVFNRMQVPRTLWDSTYIENGWIGQYFHQQSSAIINRTQRIIGQQYPGTKLSVSEFYYGGATHISGAIAMADVLGIFASGKVYFASLWGDIAGYIASAYRMYTNYDGNGGTFGDINVRAATSDVPNSSVHAAAHSENPSTLHIIALNRSFSRTIAGHFVITSPVQFTSGLAYAVMSGSTAIQSRPGISSIQGNQFTYSIPPLSVFHFVLSGTTDVAEKSDVPSEFELQQNYPNPFNPTTTMRFSLPSQGSSNEEDKAGQSASGLAGGSFMSLKVYDVLGREVSTLVFQEMKPGRYERTFDGNGFSSGVYFARLQSGNFTAIRKMILVR